MYDSDSDDDYSFFSGSKKDSVRDAINVVLRRDDSQVYYDAYDVKWSMQVDADQNPIGLSETKRAAASMLELICQSIEVRGIEVVRVDENPGSFVNHALLSRESTSDVRNLTSVSTDVFSTMSFNPAAALADLTRQVESAYARKWRGMKGSVLGINLIGENKMLKRAIESTDTTEVEIVKPITRYVLAIHRGPTTPSSKEAVGARRKRIRLETDIVKAVDAVLQKDE